MWKSWRNVLAKAALLALMLAVGMTVSGCQTTGFRELARSLPAGENVVPSPALCRRARASDDARVVALAASRCARENQGRLRTGRDNYDRVRAQYGTGGGA